MKDLDRWQVICSLKKRKNKIVYIGRDGKSVSDQFIIQCLYTSCTYLKYDNFGDEWGGNIPMLVVTEIIFFVFSADKIFKWRK